MCGEKRILHRLFTCESQTRWGSNNPLPPSAIRLWDNFSLFYLYVSPKCFEHNEMLFPFRECLAMLYIVRDDQQKLSDDLLISETR